jgi:hypothetical protein
MSKFKTSVLDHDLDFLISETGKELIGVSPAAIAAKTFIGSFQSLEEGYEVELSGREVMLDSEIVINGNAYATLPTKGAVLKDLDGTHYKIFEIKKDFSSAYKMNVASQYAANAK